MKPISKGLDFLQGGKESFLGQQLPTLLIMQEKLLKVKNNATVKQRRMERVVEKLYQKFNERFESHLNFKETSVDAIVAAVSHPAYKLDRWRIRNSNHEEIAQQLFFAELRKMKHALKTAPEKTATQVSQDVDVNDDDDMYDFLNEGRQNSTVQTDSVEAEGFAYLNSTSTSLKMLEGYPTVKKLFIRFNTSLNSSGAIERIFNYAGITNDPRRGSMVPTNFSSCVFLKGNSVYGNNV